LQSQYLQCPMKHLHIKAQTQKLLYFRLSAFWIVFGKVKVRQNKSSARLSSFYGQECNSCPNREFVKQAVLRIRLDAMLDLQSLLDILDMLDLRMAVFNFFSCVAV